jgi:RNA polymerase primary sigma factor
VRSARRNGTHLDERADNLLQFRALETSAVAAPQSAEQSPPTGSKSASHPRTLPLLRAPKGKRLESSIGRSHEGAKDMAATKKAAKKPAKRSPKKAPAKKPAKRSPKKAAGKKPIARADAKK